MNNKFTEEKVEQLCITDSETQGFGFSHKEFLEYISTQMNLLLSFSFNCPYKTKKNSDGIIG